MSLSPGPDFPPEPVADDPGAQKPTPPTPRTWQSRLLGICFAIFTLEIGLFLIIFPWMDDTWDINYFQTVIPVTRYKNGRVDEIRLYPFAIEADGGPAGGMPHPASSEEARRILSGLQTMSAVYHTRISIENNIGVIRNKGS